MENSTGKRYLKQIWRFAPRLWYFYCPVPHAWLAECAGLMVLKLTISNITGLTLHKLSHTEMFALALDWWAYTAVFSALFDQYTWVMQGAGFTLHTEYSESEQKAINERYYYPLLVLDVYSELLLPLLAWSRSTTPSPFKSTRGGKQSRSASGNFKL